MPKLLSILITLIILVSACSSTKEVKQKVEQPITVEKPEIVVSQQDSLEAKAYFLQGIQAFQAGEQNEAIDLLTMAIIKMPNSSGINHSLSDAYLSIGDLANGIYYAKEAARLEPENTILQLRLAYVYEQNGEIDKAIEQMETVVASAPTELPYKYQLGDLLTKSGRLSDANRIYLDIINQYGEEETAHYRRYLNFNTTNELDSAAVELDALAKINPSDISLYYSLADLNKKTGNIEKAKSTLERILAINSEETRAFNMLFEITLNNEDFAYFDSLTVSLIESDDVLISTKEFIIQTVYAVANDSTTVTIKNALQNNFNQITEEYVVKYPKQSGAQLFRAYYYLMVQDLDEAESYFKSTIQINKNEQRAWNELIQLYLQQSDFDKIIEMRDELDKALPENPFVAYAIGVSYFSINEYKGAVKWLKKGSLLPSNRAFKSAIFAILGDSYHELDNWEQSIKSYESAIKLQPNNGTALNNYAYYLSLRKERLNEAKLMSKKSLDLEPNNPSFLDTYGWILFQVGEYETAKIYVQKAIDNGGGSAEVLEHMGDIEKALGKMDEAKNWWRRAYEQDTTRTHLKPYVSDN